MNQRSKYFLLAIAGASSIVTLLTIGLAVPIIPGAGTSSSRMLKDARGVVARLASLIENSSLPSDLSGPPSVSGNWPPIKGERFPELFLPDQNGEPFRLSDFEGQTIFIEYAAVPCHGCQAFAGGKECGAFGGYQVQPGLDSIETYAKQFANVQLGEDVVFIQILLYGSPRNAPTAEQVSGWAKHFRMERDKNKIVLRGNASLLNQEVFDMIPGFHLIDRDFVLRSDSCGHHPQDDLYRDLLPLLGKLCRASAN